MDGRASERVSGRAIIDLKEATAAEGDEGGCSCWLNIVYIALERLPLLRDWLTEKTEDEGEREGGRLIRWLTG